MKTEKGKIIPGIKKLVEVETQLRTQILEQPAAEVKQRANWVPPTPEQLREHKKRMGRVYLGQTT